MSKNEILCESMESLSVYCWEIQKDQLSDLLSESSKEHLWENWKVCRLEDQEEQS